MYSVSARAKGINGAQLPANNHRSVAEIAQEGHAHVRFRSDDAHMGWDSCVAEYMSRPWLLEKAVTIMKGLSRGENPNTLVEENLQRKLGYSGFIVDTIYKTHERGIELRTAWRKFAFSEQIRY